MQMPDGYEIPDDPDAGRMDAAYLRTCLGIPTPMSGEMPEFPLSIRQAHFYVSRALSRMGALGRSGMDATQIAMVYAVAAMTLGWEVKEKPAAPRTFLDLVDRVEHGSKVVVRWRAKDTPGHFVRVEDGRVVVLHDGNERKFQPQNVRLPKEGEFPEVAANITETASVG